MKKNWLDDIHDKLDGLQADEPAGLWNELESQLDAGKRRPAALIWLGRCAAVAAMLALAFGAAILFQKTDEIVLTPQYAAKTVSNINNKSVVTRLCASAPIKQAAAHDKKNVLADADAHKRVPTSNPIVIADDTVESSHVATASESTPESVPDSAIESTPLPSDGPISMPHKSPGRKLALAAHISGATLSGISSGLGGKSPMHAASSSALMQADPMFGVLISNKGKAPEAEIKHRLPLNVGLSLDYGITRSLSLTTGLTYSRLVSDLKYGGERSFMTGDQTLHYLGIPLGVKYNVATWKRLDIYASAGIMAQLCMDGKTRRDYFLDGEHTLTERESTRVRQLQMSANASVGAQLNITPSIGLYAEPGIGYWIDNGSPIKTIYKDRPLNFNLNLGLRFSIGK